MQANVIVYLAGVWQNQDAQDLLRELSHSQPRLINQIEPIDEAADPRAALGKEGLLIYTADALFLDTRHRPGIEAGAALVWAKSNQIPVVTWHDGHSALPALIASLSDALVESTSEGAQWIENYMRRGGAIKSLETMRSAMRYYCSTHLKADEQMMTRICSHSKLIERVSRIHPAGHIGIPCKKACCC